MNSQSKTKSSEAGSSYFGGKGGSGVYQTLINQIPPHDFLVVPFAGHCAVTRHMELPNKTIICDRDPAVIAWWKERQDNANRTFGTYPYILVRHRCGMSLLSDLLNDLGLLRSANPFGRVFVYCDPPYPAETLKSESRYQFDLTDADHDQLLKLLQSLNSLPVDRRPGIMISSYFSERYATAWRSGGTSSSGLKHDAARPLNMSGATIPRQRSCRTISIWAGTNRNGSSSSAVASICCRSFENFRSWNETPCWRPSTPNLVPCDRTGSECVFQLEREF